MADVTISSLSPLTPSTGLVLPVSNGATTGSVTLSQVCGVMTSAQITTALGYTPYNGSTNPSGYITAASLPSSNSLVKAWVKFDGRKNTSGNNDSANTDRYIISSFNINRVNKQSSGTYVVYFTTALASANYIVSGSAAKSNSTNDGNSNIQAMGFNSGDSNAPTASLFYLKTVNTSNAGNIDVITAIMVVGG